MTSLAVVFGLMFVTMMSALVVEYRYSLRHQLDWHVPGDTLANLNLAGGRMALGVFGTGLILAAYHLAWQHRWVDLTETLPLAVAWPIGLLLVEFLQYWSHRLAHRWRWLGWAHLTHHSSSRLNLSTSMRIGWVYRYYIWVAYLPLALLGFGVVEFVAFQGILNGYNQFLHTRFDPPYGPLKHVLLTPAAHRLHHVREPDWFGNYGAMFSIYDRLFGTYRVLPDPDLEASLHYGMERNHDTADIWALNVAPLRDQAIDGRLGAAPSHSWWWVALFAVYVMGGVLLQARLDTPTRAVFALVGVLLCGALSLALAKEDT